MLSLLLLTVITSATDSLNPMGIAQQFLLQGLVKKKHHILIYIFSMGLTNFTGGLIVYFGAGAFIKKYMNSLLSNYSNVIYLSEFILGILILLLALFLVMKISTKKLKEELLTLKEISATTDSNNSSFKLKSAHPSYLFFLGSLSACMELTTALPYFAFLAILLTYKLPILAVVFILIIYNIIYSLPLLILYFLYVRYQSKFDELYIFMKNKISKYAEILSPILVVIVGVLLIYHSLNSLFSLIY